MSERRIDRPEFEPITAIMAAMQSWLQAEIENSSQGRNAILDDWDRYTTDLYLPYDSSENQKTGKHRSHYNRLVEWTVAAEQDPVLLTNEYWLARQLWCAQMFISGAYREQCFAQAVSPADYQNRRQNQGPVDIDIGTIANARWQANLPGGVYKNTPWAGLMDRTLQTNDDWRDIVQLTHERGLQDRGKEDSTSVKLYKTGQRIWTELAVDYILFAAHQLESPIAEVLFLEPKSITEDPQLYNPFTTAG
ncbi:MAG TPA: hypothetical protein VF401_01205 [Candidatus Saccharimonadales bacterium]